MYTSNVIPLMELIHNGGIPLRIKKTDFVHVEFPRRGEVGPVGTSWQLVKQSEQVLMMMIEAERAEFNYALHVTHPKRYSSCESIVDFVTRNIVAECGGSALPQL
jgi:hypothetical protein